MLGKSKLLRWMLNQGLPAESEGSLDSAEQLRGPDSARLEVHLRQESSQRARGTTHLKGGPSACAWPEVKGGVGSAFNGVVVRPVRSYKKQKES